MLFKVLIAAVLNSKKFYTSRNVQHLQIHYPLSLRLAARVELYLPFQVYTYGTLATRVSRMQRLRAFKV